MSCNEEVHQRVTSGLSKPDREKQINKGQLVFQAWFLHEEVNNAYKVWCTFVSLPLTIIQTITYRMQYGEIMLDIGMEYRVASWFRLLGLWIGIDST